MKKTYSVTRLALIFALCIILNFLESAYLIFPSFPGVKLGLSNIPVMFSLICLGAPSALSVSFAKSLFVLITRGVSAGILSITGGLLSIGVMWCILKLTKKTASLSATGISGALAHNIGQLCASALLWKSTSVFTLFPILAVSACIFGVLNALLLHTVMPYLNKIGAKK